MFVTDRQIVATITALISKEDFDAESVKTFFSQYRLQNRIPGILKALDDQRRNAQAQDVCTCVITSQEHDSVFDKRFCAKIVGVPIEKISYVLRSDIGGGCKVFFHNGLWDMSLGSMIDQLKSHVYKGVGFYN